MASIPPKLIVVMAFDEGEDGDLLPAFEPRQYDNADKARRDARLFAERHAGAIAWSRSADPNLGDSGEPEILFSKGKIPDME